MLKLKDIIIGSDSNSDVLAFKPNFNYNPEKENIKDLIYSPNLRYKNYLFRGPFKPEPYGSNTIKEVESFGIIPFYFTFYMPSESKVLPENFGFKIYRVLNSYETFEDITEKSIFKIIHDVGREFIFLIYIKDDFIGKCTYVVQSEYIQNNSTFSGSSATCYIDNTEVTILGFRHFIYTDNSFKRWNLTLNNKVVSPVFKELIDNGFIDRTALLEYNSRGNSVDLVFNIEVDNSLKLNLIDSYSSLYKGLLKESDLIKAEEYIDGPTDLDSVGNTVTLTLFNSWFNPGEYTLVLHDIEVELLNPITKKSLGITMKTNKFFYFKIVETGNFNIKTISHEL